MKLIKLPSGMFLNLDNAVAFKPGIGGLGVMTPTGAQFDIVHDDAKALKNHLDEVATIAAVEPRAESFAEIVGGGH